MSTAANMKITNFEVIRLIVSEVLEITPEEVLPSSHFQADLGGDSLASFEIMTKVEKAFNIVIPRTELPTMVNLDKVYEVVASTARWME